MNHNSRALLIFIADIIALFCAFFLSAYSASFLSGYFDHQYSSLQTIHSRGYSFVIMGLLALALFYSAGHYSKRVPWWSQVRYVTIVFFSLMVMDGFLHFALQYFFSRLLIVLSWFSCWILLLLFRQIAQLIGRGFGIWCISTAVIGDGENAIDSLYAFCSDFYSGYKIKALLLYHDFDDFSPQNLPKELSDIEIIKGAEECQNFILKNKVEFYILAPEAMQRIEGEKLIALISELYNKHNYAIVPPTKGLALYGQRPDFFFGYDIMLFHPLERINYPYKRLLKRCMDIIISILSLIILSPLLLIIIVIIKLESAGPVLFAHRRIGYKGREFFCLKFRTMVKDAEKKLEVHLRRDPEARMEWEREFKLKNDPRITKIGNFLRKSSLDELPQLFNILVGNMSLVGPRPIIKEEIKYYGNKFRTYISVKPGITGLWQVSGRNNVTYKYRIYLDNWYIENWSIWHDMVILIKTISVVLMRSGAY